MFDSFVVHLGGGSYLDASGKIVFGPPTGTQVYQAPHGFKIDAKKIQDVFKDLRDILPADDAAKKKWANWGIPKNLINMLGSVAGVAGAVATAASVYFWVLGVMLTIMDMMASEDGMSPELARTLFNIKNQLQGVEQLDRADRMIQMHSEFDGRIDRVRGLLMRLQVEKPIGTTRANIFAEMQSIVNELAVPLSRLRNQEWATTYDADSYKGRAFASHLLVFENSDGSLPGVPMVSPNVTVFDYRLGVPMLLFGCTSFASLLQIAMPWFRSAGMYAGQLRKTADAIDRFVIRMQNESISHTHYTWREVMSQDSWGVFEIPSGGGPKASNPFPSYAVGAFDLVAYNDAFLWDRFVTQFQAGSDTSPRGLFNYHWKTAATSLDDIAIAANEQAKADYANLQVATGMFRLISTAAWLRFLSTPPARSQTVSGYSIDSRSFISESPTVAESRSIRPVGVIKHDATLKKYQSRTRFVIRTQEPGYIPAFRYRVVLRLVHSLLPGGSWHTQEYNGDIFQTEYEPTVGDIRCNRLRTNFKQNSILSELVLHEGTSPIQTVNKQGEAKLRASTFDWYVPVVSWDAVHEKITDMSIELERVNSGKKISSGGTSHYFLDEQESKAAPVSFMSNGAPLRFHATDEFFEPDILLSMAEVNLEKAERRHVKLEEITINWQLSWAGDRLEVRLWGKPDDRPFQVYVVVEETVYSGETPPDNIGDILSGTQLIERLHTPVSGDMVNQIVFVPQAFFDKERKAIQEAARLWSEFLRRYIRRGPVGPGDPIEFIEKSIHEKIKQSPSTATLMATMEERLNFAERHAPELWMEVKRESFKEDQEIPSEPVSSIPG